MQIIVDGIRRIVVLVLLMELVLQLQSGKQYESYIKVLVGIMVVYSVVQGIFGTIGISERTLDKSMQEFKWKGKWEMDFRADEKEDTASDTKKTEDIFIEPVEIGIHINEIVIEDMSNIGGTP